MPQKGPLQTARNSSARNSAGQEQDDKLSARQGQAVEVWAHDPNLVVVTEAAVDPKYNLILAQCRARLPHDLYAYVRDNIQESFKNSLRDTPDDMPRCSLDDLRREGVDCSLALSIRFACDPDNSPNPPYMWTERQAAERIAQAHKVPETADDDLNNQNDKVSTKSPPTLTGTLYKVARQSWQAAQQCWRTGGDEVDDKLKAE